MRRPTSHCRNCKGRLWSSRLITACVAVFVATLPHRVLWLVWGRSRTKQPEAPVRVSRLAVDTPTDLLQLRGVDPYSLRGMFPNPVLKLPGDKQSIFDGPQPPASDEVAGSEEVQAAGIQLVQRLVGDVQLTDLLTTAFLLCALILGLLDTRRRWLDYASEAIGWVLHGLGPGAVSPSVRVSGRVQDIEVARLSWPEARQLGEFLQSAKITDQLRALAAADAAMSMDVRLAPLVEAVRMAAAGAAIVEEGPLPTLSGEWECLVDYFTSGKLVDVQMSIQGDSGRYRVDGKIHRLSDVVVRMQGSLWHVTFRWANRSGDVGSGVWLLSGDGNCIDGTWSEDGSDRGPWVWTGLRKQVGELPASVGRAPPRPTKASDSAGTAVAQAAAEVMLSSASETPTLREALACAWDNATPGRVGGVFSQSAVLPRRWQALGRELRMALGLTYEELVAETTQRIAQVTALTVFVAVSFVTARGLAVGLGSSSDALAWASFAAASALVLDFTMATRREGWREVSRSPEDQARRDRCLGALCRWADAGGLIRSGSAPRETVIAAVRRAVPELRVSVSDSDSEVPGDAEVERLLRVWHPGLRRRVSKSLASLVVDPGMPKQQESAGIQVAPVVVIYENLSVNPEISDQSIWR